MSTSEQRSQDANIFGGLWPHCGSVRESEPAVLTAGPESGRRWS